ncbi:MAG: hypothetical protein Q4D23_11955 [Bacteroidales bacterium]|nr:hypothetical protein [Bacteroidales bacterium]
MNTQKEPKYSALVKISKRYPEISLEWLFLGEGEMIKAQDTRVHNYAINYGNSVQGDNNITGNTAPVSVGVDVEKLKEENAQLKKKNEELTERCFTLTDKLTKLL